VAGACGRARVGAGCVYRAAQQLLHLSSHLQLVQVFELHCKSSHIPCICQFKESVGKLLTNAVFNLNRK